MNAFAREYKITFGLCFPLIIDIKILLQTVQVILPFLPDAILFGLIIGPKNP